jgi:hypothetical protein
MMVLR